MAASAAVLVSNWLAFLCLSASFLGLLVFTLKYKGPTGKEAYYNGFREQNMLGVFINLFCAVSYFAKVVASHSTDDGFAVFTTIRYLDYLTQCPLTTVDLLWNLEAPYKVSGGALVLTCLTFAVATDSSARPQCYVWFGTGLSFFIFSYTFILVIVKERLTFFASCARDSNAKKSIRYLKIALFSYFGIWIFFPILWLTSPKAIGLIDDDTHHVFHCILDVMAKSCYGFALLYFKVFFEKKLCRAGIDEEEFQKFSKDLATHKHDDDDDRGNSKRKKSKRNAGIGRIGEISRTSTASDLELGAHGAAGWQRRFSTPTAAMPVPATRRSPTVTESTGTASGVSRAATRRDSEHSGLQHPRLGHPGLGRRSSASGLLNVKSQGPTTMFSKRGSQMNAREQSVSVSPLAGGRGRLVAALQGSPQASPREHDSSSTRSGWKEPSPCGLPDLHKLGTCVAGIDGRSSKTGRRRSTEGLPRQVYTLQDFEHRAQGMVDNDDAVMDSSEEEDAAFVERARQAFELRKAQSRQSHSDREFRQNLRDVGDLA